MTPEMTLASGGRPAVPVPDPIARDYLLLALRIDQHTPGIVDAYFGPADLKAQVDLEQLRAPAGIAADAETLADRVQHDVPEPDRRAWLAGQVRALAAQADAIAGTPSAYVEQAGRLFDWEPVRRDEAVFDDAADAIDRLLPGTGSVAERLEAWDERFTVPPDRIIPIAEWLAATFRERARTAIGLPPGESVHLRLVRDQPWSAYNWYQAQRRSRFDINTDLPMTASDLVHLAAHEAYPGHHLENCWKEAELVDRLGRIEATILLINTPQSLISEGLADLGHEIVSPRTSEPDLLVELYGRAGLPIALDGSAAADAAVTTVALQPLRRRLSESRVNAALMRHGDGASHDDVLGWLERVGRFAPAVARKRLEFIENPLWRAYVFVYHEGEALLRRWLEAVPPAERAIRFGRLLREQLGPSAITAELESAGGGPPSLTTRPGIASP